MGWKDSTIDQQYLIKFWAYNPRIRSEIVYHDYYNRLYTYNFETQNRVQIDSWVQYPPRVNAYGEITYNKVDSGVYIYSTVEKRRKEMPLSRYGRFPKWDYSGQYIFYSNAELCIKCDKSGRNVDTLLFDPFDVTFAKTTNNYLFVKDGDVFIKDAVDGTETFLFTETRGFMTPCFARGDSHIYWWDWSSRGLHSFNLHTKEHELLLKSCENFFVASLNISPNSDKLTMICHLYSFYGSYTYVYRRDLLLELDLETRKWRELHIPHDGG